MNTKQHQQMYSKIKEHGKNLNRIFETGLADVKLCKMLFRLEAQAHKLATDYCNGENGVTTENWESKTLPILIKLDQILKFTKRKISIFVNGDARGYALKIAAESAKNLNIDKDWGGYGIIAPDFTSQEAVQ